MEGGEVDGKGGGEESIIRELRQSETPSWGIFVPPPTPIDDISIAPPPLPPRRTDTTKILMKQDRIEEKLRDVGQSFVAGQFIITLMLLTLLILRLTGYGC